LSATVLDAPRLLRKSIGNLTTKEKLIIFIENNKKFNKGEQACNPLEGGGTQTGRYTLGGSAAVVELRQHLTQRLGDRWYQTGPQ
jgi:hypothetical protein